MMPENGFVEINGARIYYELAGDGQPLVLIHAGVADSRQWNNEFLQLAQSYRVLRYDLRGYGKSLPVEGEFSHLKDLVSLLDALHLNQPLVFIGCSMGGTLAMDFALEFPTQTKALVMVGSGPYGLSLDVPDHPKDKEAEQAYEAGNLELLAELEAQIWFDGMGRPAWQVNQEMRRLALEMNRLALAHEAKGLGKRLPNTEILAAERLGELEIPLMVIVGEHDIPYIQAAADFIVDNIPFSQKVLFEDSAHLLNMDQPERFLKTLRSFLETNV